MADYDPLIVFLKIDQTEAQRENAKVVAMVKKTQSTWNRVRNTIVREQGKVMRSVYQTVVVFRSVVSSLGLILTPLQEAALAIAAQALMTVVQVHAILAAGTSGASLAASAGPLALALAAFTASEIAILQKREQAAREFRAAEAALAGIETIASIWI